MIPGLPISASVAVWRILNSEPRILSSTVYGSRAKGTFREGSDVDICLDAPELDFTSLTILEDRIDDLMLPWKFDLSVRHKITDPALLEHIDRVGMGLA